MAEYHFQSSLIGNRQIQAGQVVVEVIAEGRLVEPGELIQVRNELGIGRFPEEVVFVVRDVR